MSNSANSMNPTNPMNQSNPTNPKNHKSILFQNNKRGQAPPRRTKKSKLKNRNSPKDKPETKQEIFKRAFDDMCKGLNRFGPKEILNLMVIHSHRDDVVHQLLTRFPTVVALGDFLNTLPVHKVDKRTFRRLERSGCIV